MIPNMRISSIFQSKPVTLSFEFFPPKTEKGDAALRSNINELSALNPDFISVTYGAGGSTRERTADIVVQTQNECNVPAMAHLTCVNATKADIAELLDNYHQRGICNILGLRGDPPEDAEAFQAIDGGYAYANELIKAIHDDGRFDLVCAAYPDGHPEAPNAQADWDRLCDKFDAGSLAAITQCFFEPGVYKEMLTYCQQRHADIRIIPGIIPVVNYKQLVNFCTRCGAVIPDAMREKFEPIQDDAEAVEQQGLAFTIDLCRSLLALGAPGLHIYTLNKSKHTAHIVETLRAEGLL